MIRNPLLWKALTFSILVCLAAPAQATAPAIPPPAGDPASLGFVQPCPLSAAEVNQHLEALARALAPALDDYRVRRLLRDEMAREGGSGDLYLTSLLGRDLGDGTPLLDLMAEGLGGLAPRVRRPASRTPEPAVAELLRRFTAMPGVLVAMPHDLDTWDADAEVPLAAFVAEGAPDETLTPLAVFDATGGAWELPADEAPAVPLVVLAYRDLSEVPRAEEIAVRRLSPQGPYRRVVGKFFGGSCVDTYTYKSYPLILNAWIWDIHESFCNGELGFGYFAAAGKEKTGNLPSSLGGLSYWDTDVWASNFQGPVPKQESRKQWEWTANGWWEESKRDYPAVYCQSSASSSGALTEKPYTIKEDDDFLNPDDYVGKVRINHGYCKTDVFDQGLGNGWSGEHTTKGDDDIDDVTYKLWCTTTVGCRATLQCPQYGTSFSCWSGAGRCSSSACNIGYDWVECNGVRWTCDDIAEPVP